MKSIKASLKLIVFALLTLFFLLPVFLFRWQQRVHQRSMQTYFTCCLWLFGLKVNIDNQLQTQPKKALYVSNHCSYLDIFVLGAYLPVKFTPKSDIASWPFVGWVVSLSGAVFIDRRASQVKKQQSMLEKSFAQGNQLMLFAEGTTSNGAEILPFKSSLFSIAFLVENIQVVPVCLQYTHLNHEKVNKESLDQIAWYADMTMGNHFWNMLKQNNVGVKLDVLPVVEPKKFSGRKELALASNAKVKEIFKLENI